MQYALDEERRMKKNLEIEHASELNTLQNEHAVEVDRLNQMIEKERKTVTDTKNEQLELHRRLEQLREDLTAVKGKLETERSTNEQKLSKLQTEVEERQNAVENIQMMQKQTRNMVKLAQDDWEAKNKELLSIKEELRDIKVERQAVESAVRDLLDRFKSDNPRLNEYSLDKYVKSFKENLEAFVKEYDRNKEQLHTVTQDLEETSKNHNSLIESQNNWRHIGSGMAERLEVYRRNVIFEIVNQLQLPMDEEELKVLQTKVAPSDDDAAIWNQILQLCSSINTQKFVLRINNRVRENYELAKQYKKEYRSIKGNTKKMLQSKKCFILTCVSQLYMVLFSLCNALWNRQIQQTLCHLLRKDCI